MLKHLLLLLSSFSFLSAADVGETRLVDGREKRAATDGAVRKGEADSILVGTEPKESSINGEWIGMWDGWGSLSISDTKILIETPSSNQVMFLLIISLRSLY